MSERPALDPMLKQSLMAPSAWDAVERILAENASLRTRLSALEADAERWRTFADGWEYVDQGGEVVKLTQERYWSRRHAPGSVEAAIQYVVDASRSPRPPEGLAAQEGA